MEEAEFGGFEGVEECGFGELCGGGDGRPKRGLLACGPVVEQE
jgi:hypothetical protein